MDFATSWTITVLYHRNKQPWSAVVGFVVHGRRCGRVNQEGSSGTRTPFSANFLPFPALLFPRRQFEEQRTRGKGGRGEGVPACIAYVTVRWVCACVSAHATHRYVTDVPLLAGIAGCSIIFPIFLLFFAATRDGQSLWSHVRWSF